MRGYGHYVYTYRQHNFARDFLPAQNPDFNPFRRVGKQYRLRRGVFRHNFRVFPHLYAVEYNKRRRQGGRQPLVVHVFHACGRARQYRA